ncbi:MAG TPA: 5'/3'-nucleotidase SurE [Bacteroidales bacterium]|nr:5'/3'-nucleotidase SurE [Bacteroidales bacterium]HPW78381.1 5'/3'-nucleotidase SurE [Bacteroidales bacterium]HQB55976.1 5'/3'-nucleotidase SurE [Bacteroidales bacterium]
MHILITNDDGYTSKGLQALIEMARGLGEITVVAPQHPQSAMSNAVSVGKPLRMVSVNNPEKGIRRYYCSGTPVDCVKMALNLLFDRRKPDLLLSGINHGFNGSSAVLYSGTLAATREAALYKIPSLAFSLNDHHDNADFSASMYYGKKILKKFIEVPPSPYTYINVNIPQGSIEEIKGIRLCRFGMGVWIKEIESRMDPYGHPYYWMVGQYENLEPEDPECDHNLLAKHYVTIVPHQIDNTNYLELERLKDVWKDLTRNEKN